MKLRPETPPLRRILAVWPHPCEGLAVIPVIEGPYRTARPDTAPEPDKRP